MGIFPRFKSLSRAVHEVEQDHDHDEKNTYPIIRREGSSCTCTSLTVWRKSLLMSCNGFTVIDSNGNLVYRVDNYIGRPHQLTLMDASGKSILTMFRRKKKLELFESWFVYEGEVSNNLSTSSESPICCVRKRVNLLHDNSNVQAYVYRGGASRSAHKRCAAFTIEGSYAHRTSKVLDECRKVLAEIKRKEAHTKNVSFGMEIFQLLVYPTFDPGFAMALVLLLDQMFQ